MTAVGLLDEPRLTRKVDIFPASRSLSQCALLQVVEGVDRHVERLVRLLVLLPQVVAVLLNAVGAALGQGCSLPHELDTEQD